MEGVRPFLDKSGLRTQRVHLFFGKGVDGKGKGGIVEVKFGKSRDKERFKKSLGESLRRKEWVRVEKAWRILKEEEERKRRFDVSKVGIGGVIRGVDEESRKRGVVISQGFRDLDSLMGMARELVGIAGRFKEGMTGDGEGDKEEGDGEERNAFVEMMNELGIESPVTKSMAGGNLRLYRLQLARQVGEFIIRPLEELGGVMTLTEVYCAYNRGRASTELVSPDDLVQACLLFEGLELGLKLVRLESGVQAVEFGGSRKEVVARRVEKIAREKGSVSAIDLMEVMKSMPIQRIMAILLDAEKRGFLCRDETENGLRFFPNLFTAGI